MPVEHTPVPPPIQHEIDRAERAIAQGYLTAAVEPLFRVVKALPDHPLYWIKLGEVFFRTGHLDEAADCFRMVADRHPEEPWSATGLAGVHERQGELEKARRLLDPLVRAPDAHAGALALWARVLRRMGLPHAAVPVIRRALDTPRSGRDRTFLGHALGECLEAAGDYPAAFRAVAEANRCRRLDYDPASHTRLVERLMSLFDANGFTRLARAAAGDPRPVFLVGMMRCGSTLVEQILAAHPGVFGAGETCMLEEIPKMAIQENGASSSWPDAVAAWDPETVERLGALVRNGLGRSAGNALRIIDKTLPNYLYLGLAAMLVPHARVIHCVRDPVDTCLSCFFTNLKPDQAWATRLDWLGHRYREYHRLMAHWKRVLPLPIHTVHYEAVVTDTRQAVAELLDFLELPWNDRCLQHHRSRRIPQTASYAQARQKIYTGSLGRAARYADFLGPLREALGNTG